MKIGETLNDSKAMGPVSKPRSQRKKLPGGLTSCDAGGYDNYSLIGYLFMSRLRRHRLILDLVASRPVTSQGTLGKLLRERGVTAAQATLSRDVRDLNLVKGAKGYVIPETEGSTGDRRQPLRETLLQFLTEVIPARNLVVVKTNPGSAMPVARSFDMSGWNAILGTVAGDDTLLLVARDSLAAKKIARQILSLLNG